MGYFWPDRRALIDKEWSGFTCHYQWGRDLCEPWPGRLRSLRICQLSQLGALWSVPSQASTMWNLDYTWGSIGDGTYHLRKSLSSSEKAACSTNQTVSSIFLQMSWFPSLLPKIFPLCTCTMFSWSIPLLIDSGLLPFPSYCEQCSMCFLWFTHFEQHLCYCHKPSPTS